jgi:hypothetical protein
MGDVALAELAASQSAIIVAGTTYYLSLHNGDPGATGASEGTGLTRQPITFGTPTSASPSVQASTNAQSFTSMPGSVTYTFFGVWTAVTAGTYLRGGQLATSITPPSGSTVNLATGQTTFSAS